MAWAPSCRYCALETAPASRRRPNDEGPGTGVECARVAGCRSSAKPDRRNRPNGRLSLRLAAVGCDERRRPAPPHTRPSTTMGKPQCNRQPSREEECDCARRNLAEFPERRVQPAPVTGCASMWSSHVVASTCDSLADGGWFVIPGVGGQREDDISVALEIGSPKALAAFRIVPNRGSSTGPTPPAIPATMRENERF